MAIYDEPRQPITPQQQAAIDADNYNSALAAKRIEIQRALEYERQSGHTDPGLAEYHQANAAAAQGAQRAYGLMSPGAIYPNGAPQAPVAQYMAGPSQAPPQQQMVPPLWNQQQSAAPIQRTAPVVQGQAAPMQKPTLPPNSMGVGQMQGPVMPGGQFNPADHANQQMMANRLAPQSGQSGDFLGILRQPTQQAQMADPNAIPGYNPNPGMPNLDQSGAFANHPDLQHPAIQAYMLGALHGHSQGALDAAKAQGYIDDTAVPTDNPQAPHHNILKRSVSAVGRMLARVFAGGQQQTGVGAPQGPAMADGSFNPADSGQVNPQAAAFQNLKWPGQPQG